MIYLPLGNWLIVNDKLKAKAHTVHMPIGVLKNWVNELYQQLCWLFVQLLGPNRKWNVPSIPTAYLYLALFVTVIKKLTICSSSVMGILLTLLLLPGVGELCEAAEEWEEDTVEEELRDVAQLLWPLVLLRGGVGGGTGLARVEQSLELRLGDKREGKLNVLVHCARLRTILFLFLFLLFFVNEFPKYFY